MNVSEVKQHILEILRGAELISDQDIKAKKLIKIKDFDLDSLSIIEFCMKLEDRLGIEIEPADIFRYNTIDELADALGLQLKKL